MDGFTNVLLIVLLILALAGLFCVFMLKRNDWVGKQMYMLCEAIACYSIEEGLDLTIEEIDQLYESMADYEEFLWRIWDWNYEHILPTEVLVLVKPYLGMDFEELYSKHKRLADNFLKEPFDI